MRRFIIIIAAFFFAVSCNLEEINENPNVPNDVPLSTLLPPTQKNLADVQGGELFRISNIFSQHMEGVNNKELNYELYNPNELDVGAGWGDIYVGSIVNLKIIDDRAQQEGSPHYSGIAKILQAQAFGLLTDTWGDVPYFDAGLGSQEPNPSYDAQELIYAEIQSLLDEAIDDLNSESILTPASDDIMYNGNIQSWIKAAYVLKARYAMHTTKRNNSAASEVLTHLSQGFISSNEDWEYPYLGTGTDINPLNSYFNLTPDSEADAQFVELMESLDDPRIDYSFEVIPFTGGRRRPGDFFAGPASPVKLASYLEQLYLLAEARLRTGDTPGGEMALQEAIELSMNQLSEGEITQEDANTYIANHGTLNGTFESDLETIITQKYLALFTAPEPWTDYRRTGYPNLVPNEGGTSSFNPNGEIPRRLIYPQSERLRNQSFPSVNPNMQVRFWWDE
jgi:hypothetical protein